MSSPVPALRALTFAFGLSQFYRGCIAVIAPELQRDLNLSAAGFGLLSSCFFLAFGIAQIPVGIAFDRHGVGRPTRWLLALGGVSALAFVLAPNGPTAMLAQAGLGLACAPVFMGLMHYASEQLPAQRYAAVVGRANAIGMLGALWATAPLGWLTHQFGWRVAVGVMALCMVLACLGVWRHVNDQGHAEARRESPVALLTGSAALLARPRLWALIPLCLAMAAGTSFRNAWGGPYLADLFGLGTQARGMALMGVSLAGFATALLLPILLRHSSLRTTVLGWSLATLAASVALALWPDGAGLAVHLGLMAMLATVGMLHPLVMTLGRDLLPPALRGRGLGLLNTFVFLGAALASWAFGQIADAGLRGQWTAQEIWSAIFAGTATMLLLGIAPYAIAGRTGAPSASAR